jgi:hypothetical protein
VSIRTAVERHLHAAEAEGRTLTDADATLVEANNADASKAAAGALNSAQTGYVHREAVRVDLERRPWVSTGRAQRVFRLSTGRRDYWSKATLRKYGGPPTRRDAVHHDPVLDDYAVRQLIHAPEG